LLADWRGKLIALSENGPEIATFTYEQLRLWLLMLRG
jgi:hypothetical protein